MSEKPTMETEAKDWPGCPMCARLQRYADTAWNRGHTMGMKANEDTARQAMDALRAEKEAHAETNARLTEDNMRLERERDEAREALREYRDSEYQRMLDWRNVEHACPKCGGSGVFAYASTSTWRGGIGGQMITSDVCDKCWGSGSVIVWPSHRAILAKAKP